MKVAALAQAHDLDIAPHGSQDIHVHLVAAISNGLILEFYRDTVDPMWGRVYHHTLTLNDDGTVSPPNVPGIGADPELRVARRIPRRLKHWRNINMAKILIIHGAGMNMRGKVQTEIFGPMTLPEYDERIRGYAGELGVEIEIFHSNIEGEVDQQALRGERPRLRRGDIQPGRLLARLSRADRRDQPGEVPHHRAAHLEPGAPRPGVRDRDGEPGHGHRLRHRRLLPGLRGLRDMLAK